VTFYDFSSSNETTAQLAAGTWNHPPIAILRQKQYSREKKAHETKHCGTGEATVKVPYKC